MKMDKIWKHQKDIRKVQSRSKIVGLNVFRLRYNGIKQHESRATFIEDIFTAKLIGTDVGNINHSGDFARELDKSIYETMKDA